MIAGLIALALGLWIYRLGGKGVARRSSCSTRITKSVIQSISRFSSKWRPWAALG